MIREMNRTIALAIASTLLLSGCAVGPKYQKPALQSPPTFRDLQPAGDASMADLAWWELFQDQTLQSLIKDALKNNYDLRVAFSRVEQARATYRIDSADLYPQLNVGGSIAREKASGLPPSTAASIGPQLSWELDIWGRLRKEREAGRTQLLASEEGQRAVRVQLISEVARQYFFLRLLDLQLEITRNSVGTRQKTLDLFQKLKAAGVNSGLDIAQAEAEVAATSAIVPDLERQIVQQENSLQLLLGKPPGPIARGSILTEQYIPPQIPAGLPSSLLERRPDIRQAEANLQTANALVGIARADFFPRISLTGLLGISSDQLRGLSGATGLTYSGGAQLAAPVFQGGRLRGNYQLRVAQWEESKTNYERAVTASFREVADALVQNQKLGAIRSEQEREVVALERSLHLSSIRYSGGLSSYLEVLDAQRGLFNAQIALAQTRGNQLFAMVELYRALGGGWQKN